MCLPYVYVLVIVQQLLCEGLLMCMQVEEGGIPNEHGTWHFGRNGWCDGQNVRPWVVDVTKDLEPAQSNAQNVVEYLGLFEGHDPDPAAIPGYIMMQSSLVLEGSFAQSAVPQVVS